MTSDGGWQRLSPWAIAAFSFGGLINAAKFGLYVVPVAFTGALSNLPDYWLPLTVALMSLHILASSLLQWLRFRFLLDSQQQRFRLRSGALFQRAQEIPLSRIQNVRLEQPLPMRLIGKINLVVETAGSGDSEAVLCAVTPQQAALLKRSLIPAESAHQQQHAAQQPPIEQLRRTPARLFVHGFCFNHLAWLMLALGPVLGQLDQLPWWEWLERHPVTEAWAQWLPTQGPWLLALAAVLLLLLAYLILSLLSGLVSLIKYHPYRLTLEPTRLQFSGGTLHRQQDLLLKRRLQSLSLTQSPLARLSGIWALTLKQVSGGEPGQRLSTSLTIPALTPQERQPLLAAAIDGLSLPGGWRGIAPYWRNLRATLLVVATAVIMLMLAALPQPLPAPVWAAIPLLGAVVLVGLQLRWRQFGYLCGGDGLWLRRGWLGQQWHYLPLEKCQSITLTQTPGLRRRGLANLTLFPASGKQTLPAIPVAVAQELARQVLSRTRNDHRNWL